MLSWTRWLQIAIIILLVLVGCQKVIVLTDSHLEKEVDVGLIKGSKTNERPEIRQKMLEQKEQEGKKAGKE